MIVVRRQDGFSLSTFGTTKHFISQESQGSFENLAARAVMTVWPQTSRSIDTPNHRKCDRFVLGE